MLCSPGTAAFIVGHCRLSCRVSSPREHLTQSNHLNVWHMTTSLLEANRPGTHGPCHVQLVAFQLGLHLPQTFTAASFMNNSSLWGCQCLARVWQALAIGCFELLLSQDNVTLLIRAEHSIDATIERIRVILRLGLTSSTFLLCCASFQPPAVPRRTWRRCGISPSPLGSLRPCILHCLEHLGRFSSVISAVALSPCPASTHAPTRTAPRTVHLTLHRESATSSSVPPICRQRVPLPEGIFATRERPWKYPERPRLLLPLGANGPDLAGLYTWPSTSATRNPLKSRRFIRAPSRYQTLTSFSSSPCREHGALCARWPSSASASSPPSPSARPPRLPTRTSGQSTAPSSALVRLRCAVLYRSLHVAIDLGTT